MRRCEGDLNCDGVAVRRDCGCYTCDGCTDDATNFCVYHVPVEDNEYNDLCARREAFLAGLAEHPNGDYDVDDAAAESYFENECRQEQEARDDA